jgi:GNAT superfamily N-acetyltransferase
MGDFRIATAPFCELDFSIREQLKSLTLAPSSGMSMMLKHFPTVFDCWIAYDGFTPVGWSLRTHTTVGRGRGHEDDEPREGDLMTYVHPDYRRMGIGTDLVTEIEATHGEGLIFAWDDRSIAFYEKAAPGWENVW